MAMSRKFLVLWVFSALALLRIYFIVNHDDLPLRLSPQSWKAPPVTNNSGDKATEVAHDGTAVKAQPDSATAAPGQGEGEGEGEGEGSPDHDHHEQQLSTSTAASSTTLPTATQTQTQKDVTVVPTASPSAPVTITLVETGGSHDEVTAAIVHAFGHQPNVALSLFQLTQRYGMGKIMDTFNVSASIVRKKSTFDFNKSVKEDPHPQILISTTCELDILKLSEGFEGLLAGGQTYLLCVIHHADRWIKSDHADKVRPWVEKRMVDFVALSEHTADFLRTKAISAWDYDAVADVQVLPPVFPVNLTDPASEPDAKNQISLAMQGDYDTSRRDYKSIFGRLDDIVQAAHAMAKGKDEKAPEVKLHLVGHGSKPKVPDNVKNYTVFDEDVSYIDFYTLLSRSFALLPSFASKEYYDRKASSSVPAALIGGVPLVASDELLAAYSYLPREAAWLSKPDELEIDVVKRVLADPAEREKKRGIIQAACRDLVEKNTAHVAEWINKALERLKDTDKDKDKDNHKHKA